MLAPSAPGTQFEAVPVERDIRVEVISDDRAFLALEPVWDGVLQSVEPGQRHPFLEFCWARTWWESFGAGNKLQILVVWWGGEPIAIAPLMLSRVRMFGVPLWRLGFLYNSHVPRTGFVIGKYPEIAYAAIWSHLFAHRNWDVLQFCQLPETSETLKTFQRLAEDSGFATGMWASGASPFVPLAAGWNDYLSSLPAKHRSNIRNRFKRIGPAALETVASAHDGLPTALQDGFRIEAGAWKGKAGTAIACSPALRAFYSKFAHRAAERGWLRLNFLLAGERRVAFDYSLEYGNRTYLLKLGYEPEWAAYAPSQLLLSLVLRKAFDEGLDRYDFLGEFMEWKRAWAKESTPHCWLYVFAPGLASRTAHFTKFRLLPLIKRALKRT